MPNSKTDSRLRRTQIQTRKHSSRMHTIHSSSYRGGSLSGVVSVSETPLDRYAPKQRPPRHRPLETPPGQRPLETVLDRDPPAQRPPRQRPPDRDLLDRDPQERTWDHTQTPPKGTWDQAARQEVTSYRDPPPPPAWTEWLTNACENITSCQTSFAGGNKLTHNPECVLKIIYITYSIGSSS